MKNRSTIRYYFLSAFTLFLANNTAALASETTVAVAANFTDAFQRIAAAFEKATGHTAKASFGATGKFYAQIKNGAPFDVILAADAAHVELLEAEGYAVTGTRFTYAIGRLVLWSAKPGHVDSRGDILRTGDFKHIAIANPKTAPYGTAAVQTMERLGVAERVAARRVVGENITQTFQFVSTGNAQLGFVALAQVRALPPAKAGSHWLVPGELHDTLRQDAALLKRGANNGAARALLEYLRSKDAQTTIVALGYTLPESK